MKSSGILPILAAGLAVAAAAGIYAGSLYGPFTFDDRDEIVANRSIEDLGDPVAIVRAHPARPFVNLSYALDYALWGGRRVFGFHLTNVVLHCLNILLLFVLARQLAVRAGQAHVAATGGGAAFAAFVAAGLLAVHPLMTQAVSYVSGRAELLVTALLLGSVYCFLRGFDGRRLWLAAGLTLFLVSLGTKESAAMLPLSLLAADAFTGRHGAWRARIWRLYVPLIGFVAILGVARVWVYLVIENPQVAPSGWGHAALVVDILVRYAGLLIAPFSQSVVHAVYPIDSIADPRLVVAGLAIAGNAILVGLLRHRIPLAAVGMTWFAVALLPSSAVGLLGAIGQPFAEHRTYLSGCGFFIAAGSAVSAIALGDGARHKWRFVATAAAVAAVFVLLASLSLARTRLWANPVELWREAVQKAPMTPAAHLGLADTLRENGECTAAEVAYSRAIVLGPTQPKAYLGLAGCLVERGQLESAEAALRLGVERVPSSAVLRLDLARLLERGAGDAAEAYRLCREAQTLDPDSVEANDCVRRGERALGAH